MTGAPSYRSEYWGPREKKSHRCADCGRTREEAAQLDVHHLDESQLNNHPENLVALCRRCHLAARHRRDRVPSTGQYDPPSPERTSPASPGSLSPGP